MILLQACSLGASPAPMPTETPTPTATATITLTPTITASPTIVKIPTWDAFQPTPTLPTLVFLYSGDTPTPGPSPTATQPAFGFKEITVSEHKIFWGSCKLNNTTITAKVQSPENVYSVVVFVRTKALKKNDSTPWTTGDVMRNHRNGTFSYVLVGSNVEGHNHYREAWVYFQLVATDDAGAVVGRSQIYTDQISLSPCR
ncbi:MAG: hypothetical protein HYZ23_05070 [Chloroflexi bacterium]|nr:hypothetical protein [Chloroflexota bacterium]